jgi:tRNA pseudouridine13 synthase
VRDVVPQAFERAAAVAARLQALGFPNYYGEQRFGSDGSTADLGFDLLAGRKTPRDLPAARRRFLLRLALSAAQSALFNQALAERLLGGRLDRVQAGDVMQVVSTGGLFVAEDVEREQQRFAAGETVITGPMFGPAMKRADGEPGRREQELLARSGFDVAAFERFRQLTPGGRRAYLVRPQELTFEPDPDGIRFRFTLPPGAYATMLLREFCKSADT